MSAEGWHHSVNGENGSLGKNEKINNTEKVSWRAQAAYLLNAFQGDFSYFLNAYCSGSSYPIFI